MTRFSRGKRDCKAVECGALIIDTTRPLAANRYSKPGAYLVQSGTPGYSYRDFLLVREGAANSAILDRIDTASCAIAFLTSPGQLRLRDGTGPDLAAPDMAPASFGDILRALGHFIGTMARHPRSAWASISRQVRSGSALIMPWRGDRVLTGVDALATGFTVQMSADDRLRPGAEARIEAAFADTGADAITWDVAQTGTAPGRSIVTRALQARILQSYTNDLQRHCAIRAGRAPQECDSILHLSETLGSGASWMIERSRPAPRSDTPLSVIVPTRDRPDLLGACLASLDATLRPQDELVIVDHATVDAAALALIKAAQARGAICLRQDGPFNYSRLINQGVAHASHDILVLLNNDVGALNPGWPGLMAGWVETDRAGAIGVDLRYPDGRYQHVGVTLNAAGLPVHIDLGQRDAGPRGLYHHPREVFAVTGAMMGTQRSVFDRAGGLDETLPHDFNDIDFCLKVRQMGLDVIWTPDIDAVHAESASRGQTVDTPQRRAEWARLVLRHADIASQDPFVSPRNDKRHARWRLDPVPWSVR